MMNDYTENTVWLYEIIPKCRWEADINLLRFEIKPRIKKNLSLSRII